MRQHRLLRVLVTLFILATMVVNPVFIYGWGGCGTSSCGGYGYSYGGGCYSSCGWGGGYSSCSYYSSGCYGYASSCYGGSCCGGCGSSSCYGDCYSYVTDCGSCGDCCGTTVSSCDGCDTGYVTGSVVSEGYDTGCANCVSDGAVIYDDAASGAAVPMDPVPGTSSPDEMPEPPSEPAPVEPLEAPSSAPADDTGLGDGSMFDEPAPADADDGMFDDAPADDSETGDEAFDDLFPASVQMRTWTDNTGTFSTRARFVEIRGAAVRLFKDNGRHCTVPFHRLSAADFQLVQRIAADRGLAIPLRLAQR